MRAVITDLAINGISIYEAENEQFLTKALNYTREISLPHDKNSLNIHSPTSIIRTSRMRCTNTIWRE